MKPYKVWLQTPGGKVTFLVWAECMDEAIKDARGQMEPGVRILWTGAQRAD